MEMKMFAVFFSTSILVVRINSNPLGSFEAMREHCGAEFGAQRECLKNNNLDFAKCRGTQGTMDNVSYPPGPVCLIQPLRVVYRAVRMPKIPSARALFLPFTF